MPAPPGFGNNRLATRSDHITAILSLLRPLLPHFSPAGTIIHNPSAGSSSREPTLDGVVAFAAPLWLVGAAWQGFRSVPEPHLVGEILNVTRPWLDGLKVVFDAFDDKSDENSRRERDDVWSARCDDERWWPVVEVVSWLACNCRVDFLDLLTGNQRSGLRRWLEMQRDSAVAKVQEPFDKPWWAKVYAHVALKFLDVSCDSPEQRECGENPRVQTAAMRNPDRGNLDLSGLSSEEQEDVEALRKLYRENSDGWVGKTDKGIDYSCEFHFKTLLLAKMDPKGYGQLRDQVAEKVTQFSWDVQGFMNMDGATVRMGDEIEQRFAIPNFLAALAHTKTPHELGHNPHPVDILKGHLMRNLRWVIQHSSQYFDDNGILTSSSAYLHVKTFIVASLHADEDFWLAQETKHHWDPLSPQYMGLRQGKMIRQNPDFGRTEVPYDIHGWS